MATEIVLPKAEESSREKESTARSFCVLGVRVDALQIPEVIARMEEWIARREGCRYIAVTGMHGVTEAQHDGEFKEILNAAGLGGHGGFSLGWMGGSQRVSRVRGPRVW